MSNIPPDLKYTNEHEWVRVEGNLAVVGISDYAQEALGDIVFVEPPKIGAALKYMQPAGVIESVKAASDFYSPLTGKVVAVNDALRKTPELVNQDCYGRGWIAKIEPAPQSDMDKLLDAKAYEAFLNKK